MNTDPSTRLKGKLVEVSSLRGSLVERSHSQEGGASPGLRGSLARVADTAILVNRDSGRYEILHERTNKYGNVVLHLRSLDDEHEHTVNIRKSRLADEDTPWSRE